MKPNKYSILFIIACLLLQYHVGMAQDDTTAKPVIKLHYYNNNNSTQYLILESMLKKNKILSPQKNKVYQLYLDSASAPNLVGNMQTDDEGKSKAFIPPALKTTWDASAHHTFIVKAGAEELISDYAITKAKISLDTSTTDGVKSITVTVMKPENNEWVPVKDVEMKLGIQRLGGILSAGDEETYTTDSTGSVVVELKKDSLPGDLKGNYTLVARVDDNDQLGNLLLEKTVPWGIATKTSGDFFAQRTLWTTRFRTPIWLLMMAYSIVIGVWGTLFYLVRQIIRIKKLAA